MEVCNAVVLCQTSRELNLAKVCETVPRSVYRPNRFPAVVVKFKRPRGTCLVFRTGKMIVTGTKNENDAKCTAALLSNAIDGGEIRSAKLLNLVGSATMDFKIDLEKIITTYDNPKIAMLEKELFPGLIFKTDLATVLLFDSGKMIITGVKSLEIMRTTYTNMKCVLQEFKK